MPTDPTPQLADQLRDLQAWGLIPRAFPSGMQVSGASPPHRNGLPGRWVERVNWPPADGYDAVDTVDLDDAATCGVLVSIVRVFFPHAHVEYDDGHAPGPEWIVYVHDAGGQRDAGCSYVSEGAALADAIDGIHSRAKKSREKVLRPVQ